MTPELHHPLAAERIPHTGIASRVEAKPAELAPLAARLGLHSLQVLGCDWHLIPEHAGRVRATGRLTAAFKQDCVVTLEPFETSLEEKFSLTFVPAGTETDDDPESEDEVPYENGVIDLGDATTEQLALSLDPYPRKPGAELPKTATEAEEHPFAALANRHRQ